MPDINPILRLTDREIWRVTSAHEERRGGLIATFVSSASIIPELPRMMLGIAKQHHTHGLIQASGAFMLHLLDESHVDWVWRFGLESGRTLDKLAGLPWSPGATGSPRLPGTLAWIDCRVETSLDIGDRTMFVVDVIEAKLEGEATPLTVQRLLALAPADKLQALKDAMNRDAAIDAAAIRAWRVK